MSKIFEQKARSKSVGIFQAVFPALISHHSGKPSTYKIGDSEYEALCVGCLNPRCIFFSEDELKLADTEERMQQFPYDAENTVCPMNAIIWDKDADTPTILCESCINCGLCARRCPFGAIYYDGNTAIVNVNKEKGQVGFVSVNEENSKCHSDQVNEAKSIKHEGQYATPSDAVFSKLYKKLEGRLVNPNLLVRNLFLALGNKCIMRRRGDVCFRIDSIVTNDSSSIGIAEIEFQKDSLESPRAILDGIAMLSSRFQIQTDTIKPFIISLGFPSKRSEYWSVIQDIEKVLKIKIHSLTLGALCLLAE